MVIIQCDPCGQKTDLKDVAQIVIYKAKTTLISWELCGDCAELAVASLAYFIKELDLQDSQNLLAGKRLFTGNESKEPH